MFELCDEPAGFVFGEEGFNGFAFSGFECPEAAAEGDGGLDVVNALFGEVFPAAANGGFENFLNGARSSPLASDAVVAKGCRSEA